MSNLDSRISEEIDDLVSSGTKINQTVSTASSGLSGNDLALVSEWVNRLGQIIRKLYGENSQHFQSYNKALAVPNFYNLHSNWYSQFTQMLGVARAIKHEISKNLIADFRALAQADIFSDFLEMGEYLLEEGYKDAAAVMIGGVLEDGLRKLSERKSLPLVLDSGKPMTIDGLNAQPAKNDIYSKFVQKQVTTWAHLRNKAAHGEYAEYSKDEVKAMLIFVQGFAADNLS